LNEGEYSPMNMEPVAAIVLAAGSEPEPVAQATGVAHKALVQVGGQPVISRVVAALNQASLVDRLVVVTSANSLVTEAVPSGTPFTATNGSTLLDTIQAGFAYHAARDQLLVVMCDVPLLTGEAVDHFVLAALDSGAELCYSMHEAEQLDKIDPGGPRLAVHLKDGDYCGGNLHLISRSFFEREGARIKRAFAARKSPVKLAAMLGVGFILRLLLRRLTVDDIVQRARQLLRCEAVAICSPYAEAGFDLDRPEQIAAAEAAVSR